MIRANRSRYTVFRHDLFELYSLNQARVLVVVFFFGCGRFLTKGLLGILSFIFDRLHHWCSFSQNSHMRCQCVVRFLSVALVASYKV